MTAKKEPAPKQPEEKAPETKAPEVKQDSELQRRAGELYTHYCKAVGGVAFNGDPLPTWDEFIADPKKTKQANAWLAVAFLAGAGAGPPAMRAKMSLTAVNKIGAGQEGLVFHAVGGSKVENGYPESGEDEDNTYAHYSPSGELTLTVANPALAGKFKPDEKYYLDFIRADA